MSQQQAPYEAGPKRASPDDGLERAIAGALRSSIKDHGPIGPKEIGSATKRILGNLRNARARGRPAPLEAGEMREVTIHALLCRCARCSHEWAVMPAPDDLPERPDRCANCKARTWDQAVPRKAGRPRKVAADDRKK
jgi:hypothetical protein